jgi:hypothetical protein
MDTVGSRVEEEIVGLTTGDNDCPDGIIVDATGEDDPSIV